MAQLGSAGFSANNHGHARNQHGAADCFARLPSSSARAASCGGMVDPRSRTQRVVAFVVLSALTFQSSASPAVGSGRADRPASPTSASAPTVPPQPSTLAAPAFSDTFQRLYFTTSSYPGQPAVPFSSEWDNTSNALRFRLSETPLNTVDGSHNQTHGQTIHNRLHRMFLYRLSGSGTLDGWIRAFMRSRTRTGIGINEAAQDMISQMTIRVVNPSGTVVRGTALHTYNPPSSLGQSKWDAWTYRNRKFPAPGRYEHPLFGARLNPVSYFDGDYLVVEIGLRNFTTTVTTGGHTWYNDKAASNLPEDEATTTNLRSWVEFSPPSPTYEQMLGNCPAGHGNCPYNLESDPVNTATGNYVSSVTDLSLPGRGLPFAFTRTYNSLDTSAGTLGRGWRHAYAARLTIGTDGGVTFTTEDGAQLKYWPTAGGAYTSPHGVFSTLIKNGDGTYELTRRDQVRYRFDATGLLTAMVDRNGNQLTFSYTEGKLTTITDTVGRTVTLAYNAQGRIETLSGPPSRTVSYTYDASGRLSTVTDARGKVWTYTYDTQHRLLSVVDPNNNTVVTNEYGSDGRISAQTDARGKRGTFAWDPATEISTYTDARGKAWIDDYERGRLVRQRDPAGNETLYTYDADFNLTASTDPRGKTTTQTWDGAGNLLTRSPPAPLSYVQTWTYNARNDVATYINGRNKTTTYTYDTAGNLTKVTAPEGAETEFGRDAVGTGLLVSLTDPRDNVTTYGYDAQANLTSSVTPLGNRTTMGYDTAGGLTSVVDPRGNVSGANPADYTTALTYNATDQILTATDPLGNVITNAYDDAGNLASVTDPNAHTTTYGYDAANNLASVTDAATKVMAYAYDNVGNLTSRTDANNHVTIYGYDDANRLTSTTDPLTNVWTLTYDAAGNMATRTDAKNKTTTYTSDAINRLTGISYADTSTPAVTFAYDANSNRTSMTDGAGTENAIYDDLDRMTSVTRGSDTFSYGHDFAGNITSRTYPGQSAQTWTYDNDGRLATANGATYGYDPAANLLTVATQDGLTTRHTWDRAGRLLEVAHTSAAATMSRFTYARDAAGNPTAMTSREGTVTYRHDALDRLTEACWSQSTCPGGTPATPLACVACIGGLLSRSAASVTPPPGETYRTYTYDPVGNRLTEVSNAGTTTYAYDAADRLTSVTAPGQSAVSYTFDNNGNQTAAGANAFAWDLADRLVSATVGGATETYTWAGDGRRVSATSGGSTTQSLWDQAFGLPQLALERDGAGATLRSYRYGMDLVSQATGTNTAWYHHDGLGSVVDATDPTGASLAWSEFYPYGQTRLGGTAAGAPAVQPFAFTGEQRDTLTGLYHLRARQYDPAIGRFLSTDPIAPLLSEPYVGSHVYVGNMPTIAIDPSGEVFFLLALPALPAIATAVVATAKVVAVGTAIVGAAVAGAHVGPALAEMARPKYPDSEPILDPRRDPDQGRIRSELERMGMGSSHEDPSQWWPAGPPGSGFCARHRAACIAAGIVGIGGSLLGNLLANPEVVGAATVPAGDEVK